MWDTAILAAAFLSLSFRMVTQYTDVEHALLRATPRLTSALGLLQD